jgi:hypothetical protein
VFKSSVTKILIIVLFLKLMCIFVVIPNIEKDVIYKKSYDICDWPQKSVPSPFSLWHTLSFLSEKIKNQVCSMMENFNGALMFFIYSKYKQGKIFF